MNKKQKIGVFDSGIGGLNVLNNLVQSFPNEDFLYIHLSRHPLFLNLQVLH